MPRKFKESETAVIRERLLATGRGAIETLGLRRTTVQHLASAAGISKGSFYLFFPSKEALLAAVIQQAEAELRAGLLAIAAGAPAEGRLGRVLTEIFAIVTRHPLISILGDPEEAAWLVRAMPEGYLAQARQEDDAFFESLLASLEAQGDVRADASPEAFCGIAPAAVAIAQHRASMGEARNDAVIALLIEGLVEVLSPPTRQEPSGDRPSKEGRIP